MNSRAVLVSGGCGLAAFALVAGVIITVIQVDPVAGILGVLAGGMAALVTLVAVTLQFDRLRPHQYWLAEGGAGFGYALAGFAVLTYLDVPVLGQHTVAAVLASLLVGVVTGLRTWQRDR